jgi:hypothetical protein
MNDFERSSACDLNNLLNGYSNRDPNHPHDPPLNNPVQSSSQKISSIHHDSKTSIMSNCSNKIIIFKNKIGVSNRLKVSNGKDKRIIVRILLYDK